MSSSLTASGGTVQSDSSRLKYTGLAQANNKLLQPDSGLSSDFWFHRLKPFKQRFIVPSVLFTIRFAPPHHQRYNRIARHDRPYAALRIDNARGLTFVVVAVRGAIANGRRL